MRPIAIALMMLIMVAASAAAQEKSGVMFPASDLFEYEAQQPLYPKVTIKEERNYEKIYNVDYLSTNGLRVPGYFYVPTKAKQPLPCVIVMHGSGGSKDDFIVAYEMLVSRGYAVLAIDAALHGGRKVADIEPGGLDWYQTRGMYIQTVVDLRRAVDWLVSRPEVDPDRIAYMGASQGAVIGTVFAGVEKRIRATVLLVGAGDFHVFVRNSNLPSLTIMRNYATEAELDKIADFLAPVDPQYYIGAISPRAVMLVNGRNDLIISEKAGMRLQELAKEPKKTYWYDSTHIPPFDRVILDSVSFFKKYLKKENEPAPPATVAEKPEIKFTIDRNFTDIKNRFATVTATTQKPLSAGAKLAVNFPQIAPSDLPLFDDGTHGDKKAGDGVWTMKYNLGPYVSDLDIVGGDKMYSMLVRAVDASGNVLSEVDAGSITAQK